MSVPLKSHNVSGATAWIPPEIVNARRIRWDLQQWENKIYRKDKIETLIYLKVQDQGFQSHHLETIKTWIHENLNQHKT